VPVAPQACPQRLLPELDPAGAGLGYPRGLADLLAGKPGVLAQAAQLGAEFTAPS
jgi:hypothetical protein